MLWLLILDFFFRLIKIFKMMLETIKKESVFSEFSLSGLLNPIPKQDFISQNWEKEPLIIKREERDYYRKLFTIEAVDKVLYHNRPVGNSLRVVKNQEPLLPSKYENHDGSLNLNQIYAAYSDGYTVVINEIDRYHSAIKQLCQRVRQELHHHVVANMYLTPPNQKALWPHYDTHDVLVIQIHGTKEWKIYDAPLETPLLHTPQPVFKASELSGERTVILEAGDFMYMPRGVPHHAFTHDESSLHLTIGIHPKQWVDLLMETLRLVAMQNVKFRKALPIGYQNPENFSENEVKTLIEQFNRLMATFQVHANVNGGMQLLKNQFNGETSLAGDGHFAHLDQLNTLTLDHKMKIREGLTCEVFVQGQAARIVFPGNVIKGPAHIGNALEFIAVAEDSFSIKEIPGLSDKNKIKLVQRLIRGGLLRVVS